MNVDIKILENISNTLKSVEVHGVDNLSKLLGCITALDEVIANGR